MTYSSKRTTKAVIGGNAYIGGFSEDLLYQAPHHGLVPFRDVFVAGSPYRGGAF